MMTAPALAQIDFRDDRYLAALIRYEAAAMRLHRAEAERRETAADCEAWVRAARELEASRP